MRLICDDLHIKNCARKLVVRYGAAESVGVAGLLFTAVQFCSIKKNPKVSEQLWHQQSCLQVLQSSVCAIL